MVWLEVDFHHSTKNPGDSLIQLKLCLFLFTPTAFLTKNVVSVFHFHFPKLLFSVCEAGLIAALSYIENQTIHRKFSKFAKHHKFYFAPVCKCHTSKIIFQYKLKMSFSVGNVAGEKLKSSVLGPAQFVGKLMKLAILKMSILFLQHKQFSSYIVSYFLKTY